MNAIDIQQEILTNALRLSCDDNDSEGVLKSAQELHQLFPDLLPEQNPLEGKSIDFYEILDLYSSAPKSVVAANYFRAVKKFLRAGNVKKHIDPSRVPRRPLPTSGDGAIELPLPERPDDNEG